VSGPLRDRLDLTVELAPVPFDALAAPPGEPTRAVRPRVLAARARQRDREPGIGSALNARLSPAMLGIVAALDAAGTRCLRRAAERVGLSARAVHRLLRVARTVADLEGSERVLESHVMEAAQYRQPAPPP
jgi:magnesium chelatase family protein